MSLQQLPNWVWPAVACAAGLFFFWRQRRWPFDGPRPAPAAGGDPWQQLQTEIVRGVLAKQGLLPPLEAPASPRVIELPRRFVIVPAEEGRPCN